MSHSHARPLGHLVPLGWDDRLTALAADLPPGLTFGRVVRVDRGRCTVAAGDAEHRPFTDDEQPVAVGDWVALAGDRIHTVLPRTGALARRAAGRPTAAGVVAANVDLVVIAHPCDRDVNRRRLERELVVAWDSGGRPLVALTKADRCADIGVALVDASEVAIGADVVPVSAVTGDGLDELAAHLLPGRTVVLLGASGAGKSTLLNALARDALQATNLVREHDGRGRHTTTASELFTLPTGALLIDTPGIRSIGVWDGDGIEQAFADIDELAGDCRFADCEHDTEPGCAVRDAVAPDRLASWRKLRREVARVQRDRAGWEVAEQRRKLRAFSRAVSEHVRLKGGPRP